MRGLRPRPAPPARAEQLGQNVRVDRFSPGGKPAWPEVEAKSAEVGSSAARLAAEPEALELRRTRLPLGVDLAAIEGPALFLIAEDLVGRANLGETLLGPRLLALVGVVFLGELAEGGLDLGRAGRL